VLAGERCARATTPARVITIFRVIHHALTDRIDIDVNEFLPRHHVLTNRIAPPAFHVTLDQSVLLVEYPGYGASPGACYERNVDRHVVCAYLYLIEDLGYDPESVILFGRSLGSGPVCRLAHRLQTLRWRPVGGVVLHSPFVRCAEGSFARAFGFTHRSVSTFDRVGPFQLSDR
jgi:pimeloyl-ACP methyl ester carboxylesterase